MGFATHPSVRTPPDEVRVWRYVDFTRMLALLESRALYFSSVEVLALEDPYEGLLATPTVVRMRAGPREVAEHNLAAMRTGRRLVYASCWHQGEDESLAMWKLYVPQNQGIAIQSSIAGIKRAVSSSRIGVFIGAVNYIDYDIEDADDFNALFLALRKRRSFEHEREVRVLVGPRADGALGVAVPVELDVLVERIYVAPTSPPWIRDLIEKLTRRFGIMVPVVHSSIDDAPAHRQSR